MISISFSSPFSLILPVLLIVLVPNVYGQECEAGEGATYTEIRQDGSSCDEYITEESKCQEAATFNQHFDNNMGYQVISGKWPSLPRGCVHNSGGYYYFNTHTESSSKCSKENKCICNFKTPMKCSPSFYSPGWDAVPCLQCPSDRPHTFGWEEYVNGSKSINQCCFCCNPVDGDYGTQIPVYRSLTLYNCPPDEVYVTHKGDNGNECKEQIRSERFCKHAAEVNRPFDNNKGFAGMFSNFSKPAGCYFGVAKDGENSGIHRWYFFNKHEGCNPGCQEYEGISRDESYDSEKMSMYEYNQEFKTCLNLGSRYYGWYTVCAERHCVLPKDSSAMGHSFSSMLVLVIILLVSTIL